MLDPASLDLRHLRAVRAIADAGTFGRAAEWLGYTQSAISQQVASLERALGAPVFDRPGGPRPVALTPLGTVVLRHADTLLDQADAAAHDIDRFLAGTLGRIDVGCFQSVLTAVVPSVLERLRGERPDVDVGLVQEEHNDDLARRVLDGEVDVAFLHQDDPRVASVELFVDPFVLIASDGDVVTGPVDPQVLHGAPVIAELDNPCQRRIDDGLRGQGVEPDVVFRTNDNLAVAAMVRAGMGMAVMPLLAVDPQDTRLTIHRLDPSIPPRHISLAWAPGRTLSPVAEHFIELAQEVTAPLRERDLAGAS